MKETTSKRAFKPFTAAKHYIEGTQYPLAEDAQAIPPVPCEIAIGDLVTFTNDYNVVFPNVLVTGFSPTVEYGRFVYLDVSAWWFPVRPQSLTKQVNTDIPHSIENLSV